MAWSRLRAAAAAAGAASAARAHLVVGAVAGVLPAPGAHVGVVGAAWLWCWWRSGRRLVKLERTDFGCATGGVVPTASTRLACNGRRSCGGQCWAFRVALIALELSCLHARGGRAWFPDRVPLFPLARRGARALRLLALYVVHPLTHSLLWPLQCSIWLYLASPLLACGCSRPAAAALVPG